MKTKKQIGLQEKTKNKKQAQKSLTNGKKGITLIALVVTIVVLLILAGVTVTLVLGEDGILSQAKLAAERTKIEEYKTVLEMIRTGLQTTQIMEGFGTEEFLNRYEEKAKNEEANGALKGSTIKGPKEGVSGKVEVTTKEGYVFEITEKEVKYVRKADEKVPQEPELTAEDIKINLDPIKQTKTEVKVTITLENTSTEYTLQYAKKNKGEAEPVEGDWTDYVETEEIKFEQNGKIYARLKSNIGKPDIQTSKDINNIDKLDPQEFNAKAESEANTVTVKGHTEDEEENDQYSKSKIVEYYFKDITAIEGKTEQIENESGWVGKVQVTEANTGKDVEYTFTDLEPDTPYIFVMKAVDEAGNERISSSVKINTKSNSSGDIDLTDGTIYYADFLDADGNKGTDGNPDGIIYADLAFDKTGQWYNTNGAYTIKKEEEELKEYKITDYNGGKLVSRVNPNDDTKKDRFYVMALKDIDGKVNGTYYCWWDDAYGKIDATLTSTDFGKGKENTDKIMAEWNKDTPPYKKDDGLFSDIWGQIENEYKKGWFVPSRGEWAAFGDAIGLTKSNYSELSSKYSLSKCSWSSSLSNTGSAWSALFYNGDLNDFLLVSYTYVRLSTTF